MNHGKRRFTAQVRLLAGIAALIGCRGSEADGEEETLVACAAAESRAACEAVSAATYRCAWVQTVTVTDEVACASAVTQQCVPYTQGSFPPGCAPSKGCRDSDPSVPGMLVQPAYREDESGSIQLVDQCGGEAVGFTACEWGEAGADPPACACACPSAP